MGLEPGTGSGHKPFEEALRTSVAEAWGKKSLKKAQEHSAPAPLALSGFALFLGPSLPPCGSWLLSGFLSVVVILVVVEEVRCMWGA